MRLWAEGAARPAIDLDLLAVVPLDERAHLALLHATLVGTDDDGIVVAPDSIRHHQMWSDTPSPGLRLVIEVGIGGSTITQQIDVGYDDPIVSPARTTEITWPSSPSAVVPAVDSIQMFAWKFHELFEKYQWQFKHLYDLHLLQRRPELQSPVLVEAMRVAFTSRSTPLQSVERLLGGGLGRSTGRVARWRAFRRKYASLPVPGDHLLLLRELADFVRPLYARMCGPRDPAASGQAAP